MKSMQWWSAASLFLASVAPVVLAQVVGGVLGVKGAPFSGDMITESTQNRPDGSQKRNQSCIKIYRDSEGRTRGESERELPKGGKEATVTIFDPVAQVFITLNPQTKTATIDHLEPSAPPASAPSSPPVDIFDKMPGTKREKLEDKQMDGYNVSGTRRSMTIQSSMGAEPVTLVSETWYSPDLKAPLLSTSDDPRSGRTSMRLSNIRKGEPDPQLFQIPPDYAVQPPGTYAVKGAPQSR
jgi:hypothetical protein